MLYRKKNALIFLYFEEKRTHIKSLILLSNRWKRLVLVPSMEFFGEADILGLAVCSLYIN